MNILITGAAGNLGSLLSKFILDHEKDLNLILMQHCTRVPDTIRNNLRTKVKYADLSMPNTLFDCLDGADIIVHFAGVLFKANPEKFLHETNTHYFKNLVSVAKLKQIKKIILISFPHVEGPTSRKRPASGRLDGRPVSMHAKTRLEEEIHLFDEIEIPISLRVGMVYGKGILMVDAAKWFAKRRLLGVWKEQTEIHLISKTDFCRSVVAAIRNESSKGIYNVGDEGNDTLQSFLEAACNTWRCRKPWQMPLWLIYFAAKMFEIFSKVFGAKSPLTKDFIDIGRVSYYGDTSRFRSELLPKLRHRNFNDGIEEMKV
ncbi:MAG: NAD(P)-dependent oxidoreductase [Desulfobulbaceae bacterium]|nr:NAD(P)-dependent oxidoreductase [Desulfobulbaceae bacterium]